MNLPIDLTISVAVEYPDLQPQQKAHYAFRDNTFYISSYIVNKYRDEQPREGRLYFQGAGAISHPPQTHLG